MLERIATGAKLTDTLEEIVRLVEGQLPGASCSVHVRDRGAAHLRLVAGASIPESYRRAIAIVPIHATAGSCGTSAFRKQPVSCPDVETDPLWAKWGATAVAHGFRSAFSAPLLAQGGFSGEGPGSVLGTLAVYTSTKSPPDARTIELVLGAASQIGGAPAPWDGRPASVNVGAAQLAALAIERERAQQALRESEERYRRMIEMLPAAIFLDSDDRITLCNPAFAKLVGRADASDVIGTPPLQFIPEEHHGLVRAQRSELAVTRKRAASVDGEVIRADGTRVPVTVVATPLTEQGKTSYLVAMLDSTEQRRADERLRSVLASVFDAVITVDRRGRIVAVNPATERMFGHAAADLVGDSVARIVPGPHAARHDAYMEMYLGGAPSRVVGRTVEMTFHRKDGASFPAEITISPFQIEGEPYFVAVVRDLTERRRLEEQYRQSQKMEAIGQLAGGVAHDFNNLLTIIGGYSDMVLSELADDDPNREPIAAVHEAAIRAGGLTAQLLAFSRKAIVSPKRLLLDDVIAAFSKMLRRLIGEDIRLVLDLGGAPGHVFIDPGQIEQVLMNLAVNARDAMPTGGRLTISTGTVLSPPEIVLDGKAKAPGPYALLTIQDTGCGMTAEVKAHIFEPFFTTKGPGRGTGLGLATLYGIVRQAGGFVTVESEPGRGTTFAVYLPVVADEAQDSASSKHAAPRGGSETILVVEDEDALRGLVHRVLTSAGYTVINSSSGEEARRLADAHAGPIHLLLTDVVMPEMGGRAVADAIRERRPATRVMYMSGYMDDAIVRHGIEAARDAFLRKPFTPQELIQRIREVLDAPPVEPARAP
ncbi:MAG: PAS domain S-box protein [Polyangiaceae bacterium]